MVTWEVGTGTVTALLSSECLKWSLNENQNDDLNYREGSDLHKGLMQAVGVFKLILENEDVSVERARG